MPGSHHAEPQSLPRGVRFPAGLPSCPPWTPSPTWQLGRHFFSQMPQEPPFSLSKIPGPTCGRVLALSCGTHLPAPAPCSAHPGHLLLLSPQALVLLCVTCSYHGPGARWLWFCSSTSPVATLACPQGTTPCRSPSQARPLHPFIVLLRPLWHRGLRLLCSLESAQWQRGP